MHTSNSSAATLASAAQQHPSAGAQVIRLSNSSAGAEAVAAQEPLPAEGQIVPPISSSAAALANAAHQHLSAGAQVIQLSNSSAIAAQECPSVEVPAVQFNSGPAAAVADAVQVVRPVQAQIMPLPSMSAAAVADGAEVHVPAEAQSVQPSSRPATAAADAAQERLPAKEQIMQPSSRCADVAQAGADLASSAVQRAQSYSSMTPAEGNEGLSQGAIPAAAISQPQPAEISAEGEPAAAAGSPCSQLPTCNPARPARVDDVAAHAAQQPDPTVSAAAQDRHVLSPPALEHDSHGPARPGPPSAAEDFAQDNPAAAPSTTGTDAADWQREPADMVQEPILHTQQTYVISLAPSVHEPSRPWNLMAPAASPAGACQVQQQAQAAPVKTLDASTVPDTEQAAEGMEQIGNPSTEHEAGSPKDAHVSHQPTDGPLSSACPQLLSQDQHGSHSLQPVSAAVGSVSPGLQPRQPAAEMLMPASAPSSSQLTGSPPSTLHAAAGSATQNQVCQHCCSHANSAAADWTRAAGHCT